MQIRMRGGASPQGFARGRRPIVELEILVGPARAARERVHRDIFERVQHRTSADYVAAYRSVSHDWLRSLCDQLRRKRLAKVPPNVPGAAFFGDILKFATTVAELQDLRHRADYDPSFSINADEVKIRIAEARRAVELFRGAEEKQRAAFLALLLFNIRQTVPAT